LMSFHECCSLPNELTRILLRVCIISCDIESFDKRDDERLTPLSSSVIPLWFVFWFCWFSLLCWADHDRMTRLLSS
jgi:hypothetical protein